MIGCFDLEKSISSGPWRNADFPPCQARPMRSASAVDVLVAVDGVMDQNDAAASCEEAIELSGLRRVPAGIVRVKDDHVGRLELPGAGPAVQRSRRSTARSVANRVDHRLSQRG